MPFDQAALLSRRSFLQLGAGSAAALTVLGGAAALSGCGKREAAAAAGYRFFTDSDVAIFSALLPVVAGPAWPQDAAQADAMRAEALRTIDLGCDRLLAPAQGEVRKLLDLMEMGLFRRWACGLPQPWRQASAADLQGFLDRWRGSGVEIFNAAYRTLVKFSASAFWAQPQMRLAIGYPGPQAHALRGVA